MSDNCPFEKVPEISDEDDDHKSLEPSRYSMPLLKTVRDSSANDDEESYQEIKQEKLSEKLLKYKEIKMLCEKTRLPPLFFVILLMVILFAIMLGFFEDQLNILIGTIYPIYMSIKTLQYGTHNDTYKWLCYWLFFTLFIWIETFFWSLLLYIPFYFLVRVLLILIMYLPQYNFAHYIYEYVLRPLYTKHSPKLLQIGKYIESKLYEIETKTHISDNIVSSHIQKVLTNSLSKAHLHIKPKRSASLEKSSKAKKKIEVEANTKLSKDPKLEKEAKPDKEVILNRSVANSSKLGQKAKDLLTKKRESEIQEKNPAANTTLNPADIIIDGIEIVGDDVIKTEDFPNSREVSEIIETKEVKDDSKLQNTTEANSKPEENFKIRAVSKKITKDPKTQTRNKENEVGANHTATNKKSLSTSTSTVQNTKNKAAPIANPKKPAPTK